jgi:hypothetical protein
VFPAQAGTGFSAYPNILSNSTFMAIFDTFIAIISLQERAPFYGTLVSNLWKSYEISLTLRGGDD